MRADSKNFFSKGSLLSGPITVDHECGCKSGMAALLIGLAISTYFYFFHEPVTGHFGLRVLYVFLISLGCAVVGKIVGMLAPKFRRRIQKI